MRVFRNPGALVLSVALSVGAAATAGAALHNRLTKSSPEKDQVLPTSPDRIRLWFVERTEPALSSIVLLRVDSSRVPLGKVQKTDDTRSIAAVIPAPLPPGLYTVQWRASGNDGHVIRGSFPFSIAP